MTYNRKALFIFLLFIGVTYSKTNPVLEAAEVVTSVVSTALDVFDIISDFLNPNTPPAEVKIDQKQLDKLVSDITAKLDASTSSIIDTIKFESQLSEFRHVNGIIDTLLGYLKNVLEAPDSNSQAHQISTFSLSYISNKVNIDQIDRILIGDGTAQFSVRFLDSVSDHLKCSICDLTNFENFYMRLASGGMALELSYNLFQNFSELYNTTEHSWKTKIEIMAKAFDGAINKCKSQFSGMAKEDFRNIENETVLAQIFRRRYADKTSDVIKIKQPYLLHYDTNDPFIFVDEKDGLRLAVFSEKTIAPKLPQSSIEMFHQETQNLCSGDIIGVMTNIQGVVQNMLKWTHPSPVSARLFLLFEYNINSSTTNTIFLEDDSPSTIIQTNCMDIEVLMYLEDVKPTTLHSEVQTRPANDATPDFPNILPLVVLLLVAVASCRFTLELLV